MTVTAVLAIVCAALLVLAPGAAALAAIGVRDGRLLTAAPAAACVPLLIATAVLRLLGVPWTLMSAGVTVAVLVALTVVGRLLLRRRATRAAFGSASLAAPYAGNVPGPSAAPGRAIPARGGSSRAPRPATAHVHPSLAVAVVVALASGLLVVPPALAGMGGIGTLNGAFDAFFHISAIQVIRERGDAFPLTALAPMYGGQASYYPASWHAFAVLVPGNTVTAANAMVLALLVLLPVTLYGLVAPAARRAPGRAVPWVLGALALTGTVFLSPAALSLAMGLWPFLLGVVVLPCGAAVLLARTEAPVRVLVLAGTLIAHPSTSSSLLVILGALFAARAVRALVRERSGRRALLLALPALGVAGIVLVVAPVLLPRMLLTKPVPTSFVSTLLVMLGDRPRIRAIPFDPWPLLPLLALAAIGAVVAVRARRLVGATAIVVLAAGVVLTFSTQSTHRWFGAVSALWYGARERVQPLLMIALLLLAATAVTAILARTARRRRRTGALAAALAVVLLGSSAAAAAAPGRLELISSLAYTRYGLQLLPYVTPAERAFIEASARELPPGSVVLGSPLDGTSLYFALGGVDVVYPSLADPQSLDQRRAGRYADKLSPSDPVCGSMRRLGVDYVYVDDSEYRGSTFARGDQVGAFDAIASIPPQYLTEVASSGDYHLYALTLPC